MFELRVLNGLHEGAALPLSGENWALGNHEDSDLQLCDSNIQGLHARLSRLESRWQLMPDQGEIYLAHGQPVKEELTLDIDQPFQLSGVWLVVSDATSPWQSTSLIPIDNQGKILKPKTGPKIKVRLPLWYKSAVVTLTLLLGIMLTGWFFASAPPVQNRNMKPVIADADGLQSILTHKLQERDLSHAVMITHYLSGIYLTGDVTERQMDILNRLMMAMKNEYDIRIPFSNGTKLKRLKLPFRIVQITAGKHANIVTEKGRRLFVGDNESGFTLTKITKDSVQFTGPSNITVAW